MSDIFISYASADRERAKVFADALAEEGWSVWWDRVIPAGRQFDEVIEEALDAAKCVVVLWSQASAASTWVKTEAAEAMRGKTLIPAIIEEGVRIPLEFRRLQAADLSRWTGDRNDPQLIQFFQSIEAVVKRSASPGGASPALVQPAPRVEAPPRVEPTPPPRPVPPPEIPQPPAKRKLSPALIGGVVAAVIALLGAGLYYEHSKSTALAEQAERMKAEQERADRERADRERADRERGDRERADRERADRERVAREDRDRASRADEERRARQQAPVSAARETPPPIRAQPARAAQPVPTTGTMPVRWRDHALGFTGNLSWNPSSALLQVGVVDLQTGTPIGNYSVPAMVQQQGPREYIVSAQFAVGGDSTTRGPHTHVSRLLLQAQQDGSLRLVQNCPRPGECY